MIVLIKRLFRTVSTMNAMNKIIDEMEKENKSLREQCVTFRNRAIASEELALKLEQNNIDKGITITMLKAKASDLS